MGRYSRKDMIEFAAYAKSWQSPKKVRDAYRLYLSGRRLNDGTRTRRRRSEDGRRLKLRT